MIVFLSLPGLNILLLPLIFSDCSMNVDSCPQSAPDAFVVQRPPAELGLPETYQKYVSVCGFPVVGSIDVDDFALKEAAYLVGLMLANRPDIRNALIRNGSRVVVMDYRQMTTDVPEHAHLRPKAEWDRRARGLGSSPTDPVCSCGEENLLCYRGDPYSTECILIHEFAHCIHQRGLASLDPSFDARLKQAFEDTKKAGRWKNTYAATNRSEYWAEGVQSWFNNNRQPDRHHNHVDTRQELKSYDPALAELCREIFGDAPQQYTKPATRLHGHLKGFDPSLSPTFRWPKSTQPQAESPTTSGDQDC